jgi:hypothetical protein
MLNQLRRECRGTGKDFITAGQGAGAQFCTEAAPQGDAEPGRIDIALMWIGCSDMRPADKPARSGYDGAWK